MVVNYFVSDHAMWIHISERLPPLNRRVYVAGHFTPMDASGKPLYGFPIAVRRQAPGYTWEWRSSQWRGECGLEWWFDDERQDH